VTRIVFLLVPGLHLLDLAGPAQAFRTAADLGCGYELRYIAEQEDVRTAQGVTVRAETNWPSLTADDLIIVPGWRSPMIAGTGALSAAVLGRLTGHHADGGTVVSICAGADALGRAGLLDGPVIAARVAREMVVYARRNGDEQQASAMLRHRNHLSDVAHRAQDSIEARFADTLPLADLAEACRVSERTLTRRFVAATGMTPLRYQQVLRVERAEHLIRQGATVEAAARTVGFQDARMLRRLRRRGPA
jgi:transcriptional regulator GlxA family with amidase domain